VQLNTRQSKTWFAELPVSAQAHYSYAHILECILKIELQQDYWEGVFARAAITPIRVSYEQMMSAPEDTLGRLLVAMGIRPEPWSRLNIPLIRKQADTSSEKWRTRFELDALRSGSSGARLER
jgi:LPS sulfotransferase NodH